MNAVRAHSAAFKKTPASDADRRQRMTAHATQHGAGWRADSMGDLGSFSPTWNHMHNADPALQTSGQGAGRLEKSPIADEPPAAVAEFVEKQWPLRWIFNYALACHGSLFSGNRGGCRTTKTFDENWSGFCGGWAIGWRSGS